MTLRILSRYSFLMRSLSRLMLLSCVAAVSLAAQQPSAAPASPSAVLHIWIAGHAEVQLTPAELRAFPQISVTTHNPHTNADETYSGVRLSDLLAKLGAPLGKDLRGPALAMYVVASGSDGYKAVLALAEIDPAFHPGEVIVADIMNNAPLDAHNGPFKLVVTEDKRPARSVRNLVSISVKAAE